MFWHMVGVRQSSTGAKGCKRNTHQVLGSEAGGGLVAGKVKVEDTATGGTRTLRQPAQSGKVSPSRSGRCRAPTSSPLHPIIAAH